MDKIVGGPVSRAKMGPAILPLELRPRPMPTPTTPQTVQPVLLDIRAVACLLGCSTKHVTRMRDDCRMPPGLRLGRLWKWPRGVIDTWVAAGCPPMSSRDPTGTSSN